MKFWKLYRDGAFLYSFHCDMVASEVLEMFSKLDPEHDYWLCFENVESKCGDTYG